MKGFRSVVMGILAVPGSGQRSRPAAAHASTPTVRQRQRTCVGMATYDDFDGECFAIQAIWLFHSKEIERIAFLVVANHLRYPCQRAAYAYRTRALDFREIGRCLKR